MCVLLMAMPRSVSSFIVCAHRSRSSVFIHFLSSTSLSAKQHQSGLGQSSCTRIDLKVGRNESLTRIASEVYFSFNQAINHITSHSFTSFLSTNLYIYIIIIRLQRFSVALSTGEEYSQVQHEACLCFEVHTHSLTHHTDGYGRWEICVCVLLAAQRHIHSLERVSAR